MHVPIVNGGNTSQYSLVLQVYQLLFSEQVSHPLQSTARHPTCTCGKSASLIAFIMLEALSDGLDCK